MAAHAGDVHQSEDSQTETDEEETKDAALADNATLEHGYWDTVFEEADSPIEWLLSWSSAKRFWRPFLPVGPDGAKKKTITIGTDNSTFPIEFVKDGLCSGGMAEFYAQTFRQLLSRKCPALALHQSKAR